MDWETTMLSHGVKPWDFDACDDVWDALYPDTDKMDPDTLKEYEPDHYFEKYEAPKLRGKPLDLNDKFDQILLHRWDAFCHQRFDILDIGTIRLKLSDLKNVSRNRHIDIADDASFGISILNSDKTNAIIQSYHERINASTSEGEHEDENSDYDADDSPDVFKSIKPHQYPSLNFENKYQFKCKWIDTDNNIHFEYFKLYSVDQIVDILLNTDEKNHPSCNHWCVEYQYKYNKDNDNFVIKEKTFDSNLFWSCCLYFHLFKTCGILDYDEYFRLANKDKQSQNNIKRSNNGNHQIFYHNKKEDFKAKEHVCTSRCEEDKHLLPQGWFVDHGDKIMRSKPVDMNDAFYVEMINRKKCVVLGDFKVIDRELMEDKNRNNNDKVSADHFNIFETDKIEAVSDRFKETNEHLLYRLQSNWLHRFVRKDGAVFDFADYSEDHRCIVIWTDDNGKQHEEWFKLYSYRNMYGAASNGDISSIYWHVCWQIASEVEKYYDQNTFWPLAVMFKVFGICGIKEIDEQYYYLRKVYKYLVSGYVNEMNKTKTLFSQIPFGISQVILKYHPFISGKLN